MVYMNILLEIATLLNQISQIPRNQYVKIKASGFIDYVLNFELIDGWMGHTCSNL